MAENIEFKQRPILGLLMQSVALMAALFSLIICILLIADFVRIQKMDPLNDPHLLQLREEMAHSAGGDEALEEQIRTFDLYARRAFFGNHHHRIAAVHERWIAKPILANADAAKLFVVERSDIATARWQ